MSARTTVVIQGVECPGRGARHRGNPKRMRTSAAPATSMRCATRCPAPRCCSDGTSRADDIRHAFDRAESAALGSSGAEPGSTRPCSRRSWSADVELTNLRGVFDRTMAEYTLGMILAFAKDFRRTGTLQRERTWLHRETEPVAGTKAIVVGAGSIGRAIARALRAVGIDVEGVGRTARDGDPDFGRVHGIGDLDSALGLADWVVLIAPLTEQTRGMFDAARFAAMKPTARFFNVGRGALVDEPAMIEALESGTIAGAGLDVFAQEPMPAASPLWGMDNVFVSPHMSGDYHGDTVAMAKVFLENFRRFRAGEPLVNVVDKRLGFVP